MAKDTTTEPVSFENQLFQAADKLRKAMDAAEYRAENVFRMPQDARWAHIRSQVKWNNEGSFLNNAHPDLKADFGEFKEG